MGIIVFDNVKAVNVTLIKWLIIITSNHVKCHFKKRNIAERIFPRSPRDNFINHCFFCHLKRKLVSRGEPQFELAHLRPLPCIGIENIISSPSAQMEMLLLFSFPYVSSCHLCQLQHISIRNSKTRSPGSEHTLCISSEKIISFLMC